MPANARRRYGPRENAMSEYVEVWSRKWVRPRVTIYKAAIRQWRFIWNRYNEIPGLDPGVTLGVAAVIGVWVVGIRWARPVVERREAKP